MSPLPMGAISLERIHLKKEVYKANLLSSFGVDLEMFREKVPARELHESFRTSLAPTRRVV